MAFIQQSDEVQSTRLIATVYSHLRFYAIQDSLTIKML